MYPDDQVILLLKFALTIGPVAIYFLTLGYLNAQSRPAVLSGRSDFILLAIVFFPLILWVLLLLGNVSPMAMAVAALVAGFALWRLMPARQSAWVVYNVTAKQFTRALGRALHRLGLAPDRTELRPGGDPVWTIDKLDLRIRISPFGLLQNVTCRFTRRDGSPVAAGQIASLRESLVASLSSTHTLPSASAAAFLIIGTVMLSAPLLLMARNMDAIVKVARSLFA